MKLKLLMNGPEIVTRSILEDTFPEAFTSKQDYQCINEDENEPNYESIAKIFSDAVDDGKAIPQNDSELAIKLHKLLPLTRFEASRVEFWHHLSIDYCSDYISQRWGHTKDYSQRYHLRWSRNAIGRLWWWAELTKQDGKNPYRLTAAINDARFQLWIIDKLAAGHSILVSELCESFLENYEWAKKHVGQLDDFTNEIWRHINIRLATVVLDAMDGSDVKQLVLGCVEVAKAKDWSQAS